MNDIKKELRKIIDDIDNEKLLRFIYIFVSDLIKEKVER